MDDAFPEVGEGEMRQRSGGILNWVHRKQPLRWTLEHRGSIGCELGNSIFKGGGIGRRENLNFTTVAVEDSANNMG